MESQHVYTREERRNRKGRRQSNRKRVWVRNQRELQKCIDCDICDVCSDRIGCPLNCFKNGNH